MIGDLQQKTRHLKEINIALPSRIGRLLYVPRFIFLAISLPYGFGSWLDLAILLPNLGTAISRCCLLGTLLPGWQIEV
jgi:hypothetical protein